MEYKDYYKILGVSHNADQKQIKKAYRNLARQYHPDTNQGNDQAAERFKEINEAYEVLNDPDKRSKYDQFGQNWQAYQQAGGGPNMGGFNRPGGGPNVRYQTVDNLEDIFGGNGGFSDFFETLFGTSSGFQGSTSRSRRGQNIEYPISVTLSEAYHGSTRTLSKDGRQLQVKIPAGVKIGSKIRISGEGQPGIGSTSESGDLYLIVNVENDNRFKRQGDNLVTEFDLPLYTALLGGTADVATLNGTIQLNIPPETQNGARFRLRGKGMPKLKEPSEYGDLFAVGVIQLPSNLKDEERELIAQLRDIRSS